MYNKFSAFTLFNINTNVKIGFSFNNSKTI